MITEANGIPLAALLSSANTNDITELQLLVEAIPPVRGQRGRPRRRPERVQGDRAYDSEPHREWLRQLGIEPVLAKRNMPHGSGLGVYRWVVERTLSWLHQFRRLRIRYERRPELHEAFMALGCALSVGASCNFIVLGALINLPVGYRLVAPILARLGRNSI